MQRIILLTLLYIVAILTAVPGSAGAADVSKVTILPFDAAEAGKYEVLKDGLRSMISARLAARENIVVITPGLKGGEQKTLAEGYPKETGSLFKKLDSDYIGTGHMAVVEGKLQLQMTFYSATGAAPVKVTTAAADDQQILPAVDILVLQVEERVFDMKRDVPVTDMATVKKKGIEGFQTEHPDRQYKEEIITGPAVSTEDGGVSISRGNLLRRRSVLEDGVISMAVYDLDGDGIAEIFIVSENNLKVMHFDRGLLKTLDQYDFSSALEVHAINVAALDGDGRGLIYLSAVANDHFSSIILDWSVRNSFQVVHDEIPFAIRPILLPDGSSFLAGQARTIHGDVFLQPGVYALKQKDEGNGFERGKQMFLPQGVNIFDFTLVDLDNDGLLEKVAITKDLKLVVFDSNNNLIWRSSTDFGGGVNYLGRRWLESLNRPTGTSDINRDGFTNADLYYLPVRLIAGDGNNDGSVDIIVAKNELSTFKFLKNLRGYKTGKVVCMSWNGSGMEEVWTTDTMDGYVADISFTNEFGEKNMLSDRQDSDKEGKIRLFVGQVAAGGLENLLPIGEAQNNLIVYEFTISSESVELSGKE